MKYDILPCTEEESDLIDEKADEIVSAMAMADEDDLILFFSKQLRGD